MPTGRCVLCTALGGELGVGRSDRFAVMALNCHEYVELYHAAYLGAGVINPLNLRLAGKELDYIVRDSGTEVAFVDQDVRAPVRPGDGPGRRRVHGPAHRSDRRRATTTRTPPATSATRT